MDRVVSFFQSISIPQGGEGIWPLLALAVGLLGTFFGYGLSLWRNRLLPWINIIDFSTTYSRNDKVEVPLALVQGTQRSWAHTAPLKTSGHLHEVETANSIASNLLKEQEDSAEVIETAITQLNAATTPIEVGRAFYPILQHNGLNRLFRTGIWRNQLPIPPAAPGATEHIQAHFRDDSQGGCHVLDFEGEMVAFGFDLVQNDVMFNRMTPFLSAIQELRATDLVPVLQKLLDIVRDQTAYNRTIVDESKSILEANSRWMASLAVSNFGSTAFLVFPAEAELIVNGPGMTKVTLPSGLSYLDENGSWVGNNGVILIQDGLTHDLRLVTEQTQSEAPNGDVLKGVWSGGSVKARVRLKLKGRELPGKRRASSDWAAFRQKTD